MAVSSARSARVMLRPSRSCLLRRLESRPHQHTTPSGRHRSPRRRKRDLRVERADALTPPQQQFAASFAGAGLVEGTCTGWCSNRRCTDDEGRRLPTRTPRVSKRSTTVVDRTVTASNTSTRVSYTAVRPAAARETPIPVDSNALGDPDPDRATNESPVVTIPADFSKDVPRPDTSL